jgi:hypothetical protein
MSRRPVAPRLERFLLAADRTQREGDRAVCRLPQGRMRSRLIEINWKSALRKVSQPDQRLAKGRLASVFGALLPVPPNGTVKSDPERSFPNSLYR